VERLQDGVLTHFRTTDLKDRADGGRTREDLSALRAVGFRLTSRDVYHTIACTLLRVYLSDVDIWRAIKASSRIRAGIGAKAPYHHRMAHSWFMATATYHDPPCAGGPRRRPSAIICLHMHDAWLSRFATKTSERRLRKVDLIIGVSDYITESTRKRFPAIADRCHTVYNSANTDRFCPSPDVTVPNAFQTEGSTITAVRR
jgi:hypothetical protein